MAGMRIDRLIVRAPGLSEVQGRHLALLIAAQLADAGGVPEAGNIPRLEVRAAAGQRGDSPGLARQIVDRTLRQLGRTI